MNIGKAAGAGIAGHIHMHVLPRWVADANFVSVIGETRILAGDAGGDVEEDAGSDENRRGDSRLGCPRERSSAASVVI